MDQSQLSMGQSMNQSVGQSMTQSMAQKVTLAQQMDELIQQNELLLKENDYMNSFLVRFATDDIQLASSTGAERALDPMQKLSVALFEAAQLNKEKDDLNKQFLEATVHQKAMIIAAEQKLANLRRMMFQFQREVLNDQQISNQFVANADNVEQVVHKMPRQVLASQLQQFYDKQTNAMVASYEQFKKSLQSTQEKLESIKKVASKQTHSAQLSQIDFEQLKIENDKLQDKVATRNQEMLRIKLSAGNCMRLLNEFKNDLHVIVENKKKYDQEVNDKQALIAELELRIQKTKGELEVDSRNLQILRQKEIGAHDGPQSVDYLALKVTQNTLEAAVKEMERKIIIKTRELENLRGK